MPAEEDVPQVTSAR